MSTLFPILVHRHFYVTEHIFHIFLEIQQLYGSVAKAQFSQRLNVHFCRCLVHLTYTGLNIGFGPILGTDNFDTKRCYD